MLNQRDSAFLVAGMILASLLDNFTTVFLIVLWLFVHNEPLPQMLGGVRPQEILGFFFRLIIRPRAKKLPPPEEPVESIEEYHEPIRTQSAALPGNLFLTNGNMGGTPMLIYGSNMPMMAGGSFLGQGRTMLLPVNSNLARGDRS